MRASLVALLLSLGAASPSMAADLTDELVAMEKATWKAWANRDAKAYTEPMAEDGVMVAASGNIYRGRAEISADVAGHACVLRNVDMNDASVRQPTVDTAILTYIARQDVTCSGEKLPPKVFATVVYVLQGGSWRWIHYQETAVE